MRQNSVFSHGARRKTSLTLGLLFFLFLLHLGYYRGMKLQPYEDTNLIFIDTEFTDLDPQKGELLSVGMVKLSGEELYLELDYSGEYNKWVDKHVKPHLKELKLSKKQTANKIKEFLGESNPYAIAFIDNYDLIYLTNIFGAGNLPFRWMTIDFASILFAHGINPVKFMPDEKGAISFYKSLDIDHPPTLNFEI